MILSCVTINKRGIYLWAEMRDVLRGIPCGPTWLCQLQTAVGLCACTLGWGVSESIVGIVQGHVRGFPMAKHGCVSHRQLLVYAHALWDGGPQ